MAAPDPDEPAPAPPADVGGAPKRPDRLRRPTDDTLGTGSFLGLGCGLAVLVVVVILAVVFFVPYLR